jgi:hypothetical protein
MGIVTSLLRRQRKQEEPQEEMQTVIESDAGPSLMILLPDAGGIAAYALHSFPSTEVAELYLDSTLRGQIPHGAVAFWALTTAPPVHGSELLVLIKDVRRKSVTSVYPFSFRTLEPAYDFIREEMMRGLQLNNVMLYWAASAVIEVNVHGQAAVHPDSAPQAPEDAQTLLREIPPSNDATEPLPDHLEDLDPDYLLAEDLAEVVEMMQELSGDNREAAGLPRGRIIPMPRRSSGDIPTRNMCAPPARSEGVVDFSVASQKLQNDRESRAAGAAAWTNICHALDSALDVHVGRQVIARLAWRRISRALYEAAIAAREVERADTQVSADMMRRAWRNIAWTLEEAACARAAFERSSRTGTDGQIPPFMTELRWQQKDEPFSGFDSPPGRF